MKPSEKKELYFSVDIECDGPIPGEYSMISIGSAAFFPNDPNPVATFEVNLARLPGAAQDPDTMEFWARFPEAWAHAQKNQKNPGEGMRMFWDFVTKTAAKNQASPVFVGYPAGFDFTFVHWYFMKFCGHSPFGFSAIDMKTYAMCVLGTLFKHTTKRNMPGDWMQSTGRHTHHAIDDAIEQGLIFLNMMKTRRAFPNGDGVSAGS